jgi:hypothetical protein
MRGSVRCLCTISNSPSVHPTICLQGHTRSPVGPVEGTCTGTTLTADRQRGRIYAHASRCIQGNAFDTPTRVRTRQRPMRPSVARPSVAGPSPPLKPYPSSSHKARSFSVRALSCPGCAHLLRRRRRRRRDCGEFYGSRCRERRGAGRHAAPSIKGAPTRFIPHPSAPSGPIWTSASARPVTQRPPQFPIRSSPTSIAQR